MKKKKILVSAYACEPDKGSEPGVGWNWVKQIARFSEVWVVTRANNRKNIEKYSDRKEIQDIHWIYYDLPRWARFWKKGERGVRLYYYLWQVMIFFVAKKYHKNYKFDIIHHLTFGVYWFPSFLVFIKCPFVWGPVGGGEKTPNNFFKTLDWRGKIYEAARSFAQKVALFDPFMRLMIRRTAVALTKASETAETLKSLGVKKILVFSEAAINDENISSPAVQTPRNGRPFRFICIGRLIHWKGYHLGLEAFCRFQKQFPAAELWFIGDGAERTKLEGFAIKHQLDQNVCFWGRLPRTEVLNKLKQCDVLLHPSLHDSGGWACLEGLAAGKPVICLNLGGPALQVNEQTGIKVMASNPEQTINGIAEGMLTLATEEELYIAMANAAIIHVRNNFNWNKKGDFVEKVYQELLSK